MRNGNVAEIVADLKVCVEQPNMAAFCPMRFTYAESLRAVQLSDGRLPDRLEQRIDALPDITLVR
jgi:hypothetical protein